MTVSSVRGNTTDAVSVPITSPLATAATLAWHMDPDDLAKLVELLSEHPGGTDGPTPPKGHPVTFTAFAQYGRCRSGHRWFWAASGWTLNGTEDDAYGWADSEAEALAAGRR